MARRGLEPRTYVDPAAAYADERVPGSSHRSLSPVAVRAAERGPRMDPRAGFTAS
jgi:hypothetical protein